MKSVKYIILSMHITLCMGLFGAAGGGGAAGLLGGALAASGGAASSSASTSESRAGVSGLPRMSQASKNNVLRLIALQNERIGLLLFAAEMYKKAGDLEKANELYRAIAARHETKENFEEAAKVYEKAGDTEKALELIRKLNK